MSPFRGEVWNTDRAHLTRILVLSGGMYNALPDMPNVLVLPVIAELPSGGWTVPVSTDESVVVDRISPFRKAWLTTRQYRVDVQTLTDINNALFKILATE